MPRLSSEHSGMIHLNGNLLCAVDVETTGVVPGFHDLIQVAILPLDSTIKPSKSAKPFSLNLTPIRIENIDPQACKIHRLTRAEMISNSIDVFKAADMFNDWFERLNLPLAGGTHKKIMPLWSNGGFDKSFLIEWLGIDHYNHYFHFHERDTQSLALSINDRYDHYNERLPFPKVGLGYLSNALDVINENAHNALSDCITTAEVYRRMLLMHIPCAPGDQRADGEEVYYGKK